MQNIMSTSVAEICENTKLAREAALLGNYETAGVYYQGVVQQIHRLLPTINDPTHKGRWQSVRKIKVFYIQGATTKF
jgi:katanin p60 ATPase-containing subunit A1